MITRAWQMSELREVGDDSEGRIISGLAIPYNTPTDIYENGRLFTERVQMGTFAESVKLRSERTPLLGFHDARQFPLGRSIGLFERDNTTPPGLHFDVRISHTQDGDDALTLIRDGAIDGVSVGMSIPNGGDTWSEDGTERTITRAYLHEMSLVNFPAYDRARVDAIREATDLTLAAQQQSEEDAALKLRLDILRFAWKGKRTHA